MNKKRTTLSEAFKISIEIDPKDIEGMHAEPERKSYSPQQSDSGIFGQYVDELASHSRASKTLRETASVVNRVIHESIEDLALREDKREFNAGVTRANENVLRSWRAFVRELGDFEKRFRK